MASLQPSGATPIPLMDVDLAPVPTQDCGLTNYAVHPHANCVETDEAPGREGGH